MIKINYIVTKSPDWKVADISNEAGAIFKGVSINRVGKKGDVFPNFDSLAPGMEVDGVLWQNPSGKSYLFPPKQGSTGPTARSGGFSKANMTQVMEKKEASIERFTDKKELGIKITSTMRMALDSALAEWEYKKDEGANLAEEILRWRKWFWENWDVSDKDFAPFRSSQPGLTSDGTKVPDFSEVDIPPDEAYENM